MKRAFSIALLCGSAACSFNGDTPPSGNVVGPGDPDATPTTSGRVSDDVIALYTFDTQIVGEIADVSGFGTPLDLAVVGTGNYEVTAEGWNLTGDTLISSKEPALKLVQECSLTSALSIEAWIRPASVSQEGPARIVGMSLDPNAANFTLAQGNNNGDPESRFNARLRSASTGEKPASAVTRQNVVTTEWTHVVFTRAADETLALYVDGAPKELFVGTSPASFPGALNNWNPGYTLNLGNELESTNKSRFWHGEYALLAIYRRDLTAEEVTQNFLAGR